MNRRAAVLASGAVLFASCVPAGWAQPSAKLPQIGLITGVSRSSQTSRYEAFRQGMQQHGYTEGKNVVFEYRYADGKTERLDQLAAELAQLKVDVIVTGGSQATRAVRKATSTIPIVMANDNDPVGDGFIASLARPGGNITGVTTLIPDINGKQLEILRETVPRLSRVAVVGDATVPNNPQLLVDINRAASAIGIQIMYNEVRSFEDAEAIFDAAAKSRAGAAIVLPGAILGAQRSRLAALAVKSRLPAIYSRAEYVVEGGLMTYSANNLELFHRAATFVDKILKGRKPAELPVEQAMKFELVINLNAAKQIGLTIPPNVLARADRVIR